MADPTIWTNVGSATSGTTATVPSLTQGTEYDIDVVASNSLGSATSAEITVTTPVSSAPSAPSGLTIVGTTSNSVTISWTASTGTAPISYQPQYELNGQTAWTAFGTLITATQITITGLISAALYNFQILSTNGYGTATSAAISTSTLVQQVVPSPPTAVTTGTVTTTSVVVRWVASATGSATILYQLQDRVTGQIAWTNVGAASTALTATATALASGTSYDFQVVASNSAGSATSSIVTISTSSIGIAPSASATLTITAITPTSATLSWSASTGTAPIAYQAQYRLTGQTAWTNSGSPTSVLTTTVVGLTAGTTYDFQIISSNVAGSATSPIQTVATTIPGTAPGAPGAPVAWIITPTSVSLTWSASQTGTAPITYQIQSRISNQGSFVSANQPSSAVSGTVSGLVPGQDYDFEIIAANSSGVSLSPILTILAPIVGGTVTSANFVPNEILTAEALDAEFDSKLDVAGGSVGPLTISQVATGGGQSSALSVVRSAGGLGDAALISGSYTALMADGPIVAYSSIGMTLTITGDANGNGPAGNIWNVWGVLNIDALRSTVASPTGSQHAGVVGQITKNIPGTGMPAGRRLADGWAVYAPAADNSGLSSTHGGAISGIYSPVTANGRDDADLRYAARITYSESTPISNGGATAEFARGLYVGGATTTAYSKVIVEASGNFSSAALDLRGASANTGTITSATPGAAVTTLSVTNALAFASAGAPVSAVNATNPMAVRINGNPYSVVAVSVPAGGSSGTLTFAVPVAAADAVQGGIVTPAAHTIWLDEGGSGVLPGDIAFNMAGTSRAYYDATGGGITIAAGTDRITLGSNSSAQLPVGTTAQRPATPKFGDVRGNSDIGQLEQWQPTTSSWIALGSSGTTTSTSVAPGPATALVAGAATSSAVPLSWLAPTTGSTPLTFQVQYRITGVSAWTNWGGTQSTLSATVSGLSANTRYDFEIITINTAGSSTSAVTSVTTLAVVPSAPTAVTVGSLTSTSATVTWVASAAGTTPISYTPQYRVTGTTTWSVGTVTTGTSETISSLSAATGYDFEVIATNTGGSATSSITTATTAAPATIAPSVPTGVSATSPTSSSLVVAFTAPATGTTPFSFQVSYRVTGQTAWNAYGSAITTTSLTVIGLNASTSYDFEVSATNSAGTSTSAVAVGVTAATTPASTGTVSGTETSGTSTPIISGPATGSVLTANVLALTGIAISDPNAATASGSCTLTMACTSGTLSTTVAGSQVSGSGTKTITYSNTLSACQAAAADLIYTAGSTAVSDNVSVSFRDQAGAVNSISVAITVSTPSTGPTGGTIPTDTTGTTAVRAQKVLNGFGVNTHIDQTGYQTLTLSTVENCINYLGGIKLLRDGAVSTSDSTWWSQVAAATNTQFIAYIPQGPQTSFQTYLNNNTAVATKYIAALEGCDEADTGAAVGYAETLAQAATFQQTVWTAGTTSGVPVIQLSCGQGYNTNPTSGNYGTVGNLSAYATYGNVHAFMPSSPMSNYFMTNAINYEANLPTPGKPVAFTEFGWTQQVSSSYNNVSPTTAAAYILEFIFSAFNAGCPYYCWDSLLDDSSSVPIGLFDSTGSPRQTATAVKNLFTLLSDTNSNALTFTPGMLNYSIANFPTNGGANGGYTTLLQQSTGVFWLAMWNDQPLNNTSTGADITVAPITVTLTLGTTPVSITVYDPSVSATAVQSASGVASLAISLPARVILVKIVHP